MTSRALFLSIVVLLSAAVAPSADLKWKRITIDRSKKGKWEASVVVLEAVPGNALTRAASVGMRRDAMRRMDEFLRAARVGSSSSAPERFYTFGEAPTVSIGKPDLISIVVDTGSYEGGAHPYSYELFENWAIVGGKPRRLTLADLLMHGKKDIESVSLLVMGKLRDREEAMWVQDGTVRELTAGTQDSFAITRHGLKFVFAPYVMGPYAAGPITVDLAWAELKNLVNPAGPLKAVMR